MNDQTQQDFHEVHALLRKRFPNIQCVRCKSDRFLMRVWQEPSLKPGFIDDRVVEIICESCGFIEKHLVDGLKGELAKIESPVTADG